MKELKDYSIAELEIEIASRKGKIEDKFIKIIHEMHEVGFTHNEIQDIINNV